jgi:hypothetical protein
MRLITLLAGYAAGLAVAMKYRKDTGTSKLDTDPNKSKMDSIIDEIVDIHKLAYNDIKATVAATWEEVEDLDGLKAKVMTVVDGFTSDIETKIAELKTRGEIKIEVLEKTLDDSLAEKEAAIESARTKALTLADGAIDTVDTFLTEATKNLRATHKKLKSKLIKEAPEKPQA